MKKQIISIVLVIAAALALTFGLTACGKTQTNYGYVSLKINPEVGMVVDDDGKVVSYSAENADAEVLLSNCDLTGMTVEDASNKVVALAVEAGYIDADTAGDEVEVGAIDENGDTDEETYEKVKKSVNRFFENNGIFGKVTQATLDQYAEEAYSLGLSNGRTKMLLLAAQISGKSISELKDSKPNELMKIINENNGKKLGQKKQNGANDKNSSAMKDKTAANAEKLQKHNYNFQNCNKTEVCNNIREYQDSENA